MADKPLTVSEMSRLGGKARAAKLTSKQRTRIAKKGAKARWKNKAKDDGGEGRR